MIDIHSHILPNVDDGCTSDEEALKMLREEVELGVTDIILTPHHRKEFVKTPLELKQEFDRFVDLVKKENIKVNLYLGQEIYVTKNIKNELKDNEVLTMNGTKYVLLEFDFAIPSEIPQVVYEIQRLGYIPIVAHLCRYSYVTLQDVVEIRENGGLIQVNADAIIDKKFKNFGKNLKNLFKMGLVDFVSSDIHIDRINNLKTAYDIIDKKYGKDVSSFVFNDKAKEIIKG